MVHLWCVEELAVAVQLVIVIAALGVVVLVHLDLALVAAAVALLGVALVAAQLVLKTRLLKVIFASQPPHKLNV